MGEKDLMAGKGIGHQLLSILGVGFVLGCLLLLEPLIGFGSHFHQLGLGGPLLVAIYLAGGMILSLAAGVTLVLAPRLRRQGIEAASLAATVAIALTAVVYLAPGIHALLARRGISLSYIILFPVLLGLGALLVRLLEPTGVRPLLRMVLADRDHTLSRPRVLVCILIAALLVPITLVTAQRSRFPAPTSESPARAGSALPVRNILFITIDALRADHLGCYGYERNTSPVIDSLGRAGVLFEHCISQGNSTELAMGSLFTSLYPSFHRVRRADRSASRLPPGVPTLAGAMRAAGFRTVGFMDNPYLKREWGLARGFDKIHEFHYGYLDLIPVRYLMKIGLMTPPDRTPLVPIPRAAAVVDDAIEELRRLHSDHFFLFIHFMDVHHPYIPPADPYQSLFVSPGASTTDAISLWSHNWSNFKHVASDRSLISEADRLRIIDFYDGAIRYVDTELRRLFAELSRLHLQDNTLVILSADHGDEFLEHGDIFHQSQYLYDELIHVPLIMNCPDALPSARVPKIVRHIDVMPTLIEIVGATDIESMLGQSLVPLLTARDGWVSMTAFSQSYDFLSSRTLTSKMMYHREGAESLCFDLASDPNEFRPFDCQDTPYDSLRENLMDFFRWVAQAPEDDAPLELDERTRRMMESLGYTAR